MRRYRLAVILGIISTICLVGAYGLYAYTRADMLIKSSMLDTIRSTQTQSKDYAQKITVLKAEIPKLMSLARETDAEIEYEVELTDQNVEKLMREVLESYTGQIFFLEQGTVESTADGVTVTLKGFRASKPAPSQGAAAETPAEEATQAPASQAKPMRVPAGKKLTI